MHALGGLTVSGSQWGVLGGAVFGGFRDLVETLAALMIGMLCLLHITLLIIHLETWVFLYCIASLSSSAMSG